MVQLLNPHLVNALGSHMGAVCVMAAPLQILPPASGTGKQ